MSYPIDVQAAARAAPVPALLPGQALVYLLVDRGSPKAYAGATINPAARYRAHISEALTGGRSAKCKWMRSVFRAGRVPVMVALEDVPPADLPAAERRAIRWLRDNERKVAKNAPGANGGEGLRSGPAVDPAVRHERMMAAKREARARARADIVASAAAGGEHVIDGTMYRALSDEQRATLKAAGYVCCGRYWAPSVSRFERPVRFGGKP